MSSYTLNERQLQSSNMLPTSFLSRVLLYLPVVLTVGVGRMGPLEALKSKLTTMFFRQSSM